MKYKYVGEDDSVYHIEHPNGDKFQIAKKAISKSMHEKIASLKPQMMNEGGIAQDPLLIDQVDTEEDKEPLLIQPATNILKSNPMESVVLPGSTAQEPLLVEPIAPEAPSRMPAASMEVPQNQSVFDKQKQVIQQSTNEKIAAEREKADAYKNAADQMLRLQERQEIEKKRLDAEIEPLKRDVMNGSVDPRRYWNNLSTGNKILASISIILGGIGAGLQGNNAKNLGLETINKAIADDIEAQKVNLGKKQSLLSENLKRYGDLDTATRASALQLNAITQAKVGSALAKTSSAEAKERGAALLLQLGQQEQALKQELANKKALASGDLTKEQVALLPEKERERIVKIGNKYMQAINADSASKAREIVGNNDALFANLDKLIDLRSQYGAQVIPGQKKSEALALATGIQLSLKEAKKLGTLDKGAEKFMEKLVSDPTGFDINGSILEQYKALKNAQMREANSKLEALGLERSGLYNPEEQVKVSNGIKYKRGPNGEAIRVD